MTGILTEILTLKTEQGSCCCSGVYFEQFPFIGLVFSLLTMNMFLPTVSFY